MNDMFGIRYSALSGLDGLPLTISTGLHPVLADSAYTGLHPVLTDSALSGLKEIIASWLYNAGQKIHVFIPC
jgi:hypothetical protein